MTFPLDVVANVSSASPWTYAVFGAIGFAFGHTLEMAGFGDSRKLAAQFYFRELTVLKVMFTAIAVAMTLLFGAVGLGLIDFSHVWVNPTYLASGVLGGLIMGVGFIVGGYCPTTSLAASSTGKIDGMMFMAGGFFGAFLFGETEPLFDGWYNQAGYLGRLTLDQVLGVSQPVLVVAIVAMALFMFWGSEWLEHTIGRRSMAAEPALRHFGAAALMAAAVAVLVIGSPSLDDRYQRVSFKRTEPAAPGSAASAPVMRTFAADDMLARRLVFTSPAEAYKARFQQSIKPVYLDVRDESDFNLYHLSGSLHVPLKQLDRLVPELLAQPAANTVFITIGNEEALAVKAWKRLVASGVPNVYVLEGGLNRWIETFGQDDGLPPADPRLGPDRLHHAFTSALGDRYKSCAPNPLHHEELKFTPRIVLQVKRDKSGGGCG